MSRASSMMPLSPLIGRQADLTALEGHMQRGGITTLLGPPGVGKTHLARHYAQRRWAHAAGHRLIWLDLTHCAEPEALCGAIATALDIPHAAANAVDDDGPGTLARIARGLASHGAQLLVLDHFDRLAERGLGVLRALRDEAKQAHIVITSRTRLANDLGATHTLLPLAAPVSADVEAVQACPAVQMLLHRASRYRFREEDVAALYALTRQLDGLPLALELAARRLSLLSPRALLERLPARLDLLRAPAERGTGPVTLRDVIESSWRDLPPSEKRLLTQCAVFRGGFDIAALESVSDVDDPADLPLDGLASLIDRSLVQELDTPSEERRFALLESIRQFAFEQLAGDESRALIQRHAEYYAEAKVDEEDLDNLLSAHEHAAALPDAQGVGLRVRLLLALEPWGAVHGARDRLARLDATLDLVLGRDDVMPAQVARLLCIRGAALQQLGRLEGAERDLQRGLAMLGQDAAEIRVRLLCQLGSLYQAQGKLGETAEHYKRAQELLSALHRPELEGRVHFGLGLLSHSQGKLEDARAHYEHAADRYRVCAARDAEAETLAYLGALLLQRGRLQEARARYHDALSIRDQGGDRRLTAMLLGNLAILEQEEGRFADAQAHLQRGLLATQQIGERLLEGHLLGYRGCLAHEMGELSSAQRAYEHALAVLREVGDRRLEAIFLACLGSVHAVRGLQDAAHEAYDQADQLLQALGDEGALGAVSVHRGQLLAARGRTPNEPETVRVACLEAAAQLAVAAKRDPLFMASDDLRFAARLLEKAVDADALVVDMDDGGVCGLLVPGGEPHDLSTRVPLRRLVAAFVAQRTEKPGEPLSTDDLIAAAWPEERMATESGMNRLKVALATLRKLGLRDLLQRREGGYLLDPAVQVRVRRIGPS